MAINYHLVELVQNFKISSSLNTSYEYRLGQLKGGGGCGESWGVRAGVSTYISMGPLVV